MVTYSEIQQTVKASYGFVPKTCWIAHVLADHGKTRRMSSNRRNPNARVHPCPIYKRAQIERTLRELGKI